MQGDHKRAFFEKMDFAVLFPTFVRVDQPTKNISSDLSKIFTAYWDIHKSIREKKRYKREEIENKIKVLKDAFLELYFIQDITPYLHVLFNHLADQYDRLDGEIRFFSTDNLEKLNDFTTRQTFKGTNLKDENLQIPNRDQRVERYQRKRKRVS